MHHNKDWCIEKQFINDECYTVKIFDLFELCAIRFREYKNEYWKKSVWKSYICFVSLLNHKRNTWDGYNWTPDQLKRNHIWANIAPIQWLQIKWNICQEKIILGTFIMWKIYPKKEEQTQQKHGSTKYDQDQRMLQ